MATIAVSGITNIELSGRVDGFPLERGDGVVGGAADWSVSGVGWNIAHALVTLGHRVRFLTFLADDPLSHVIRGELARYEKVDLIGIQAPETPRSIALVADDGSRAIISDRRGADQIPIAADLARSVLAGCDLAVLTNMSVNRPLFGIAAEVGVPTSVDLHIVRDLDHGYDADFVRDATLLFMSADGFPAAPADCLLQLRSKARHALALTCGMGAQGAMTLERDRETPIVAPAVAPQGVVDTTGAGDALHAAFVDGFLRGLPAEATLRRAVHFAGCKVGVRGASGGHISLAELEAAMK